MPGHRWSPAELPSLVGTSAVVTGANSGIGWYTALELARHGARVVLAVRSPEKGEAAAQRIREAAAGADVRVARLDLGSLASVQELAEAWEGQPLGLLVNNAGLMTPPRYRQTSDGFELQIGTNHLGHFALTGRLLPSLLAAPAPRVVTVSSITHHRGSAAVLDGNPADGYDASAYYANSKLANLLFALELQRLADSAGAPLTSTAAHPGVSATNLITSEQGLGSRRLVRIVTPLLLRLVVQSAAAGAEPTLYAATMAEPGSYTGPQRWRESRGPVGPARLSAAATDEALAAKLWSLSEDLTGVHYEWPDAGTDARGQSSPS
jgi:NAD(P)-dependent dehydrogenase (short-subunit alcohol dehydrogenase family)